jgi:hypothetical protein
MDEPDRPLIVLTPGGETPTRRRRGRPRAAPHVSVTAWIPAPTYDRVTQLARRHETSVSRIVSHALHTLLHKR